MKTYETYKDSGIEWIGEIPTDWNVARLRYRGKSIIGITYKPDEVSDETNGTLVLRSSNVQNGKLDFKDCVYVDKKIQESQLVKEGDILVCARNGSAHLVGKCAYIPKEWENVSFGAFMSIVRTDLDKFLFYYFNSQVFKGQKGLFATSTINQLTSNMLNNLDIPIPPTKEEQKAIAKYLDKKTEEIDQLIIEKKQLVQLHQEEKTAIINQAVTKGINPDVKLKESGIEWLGDIPEHWEIIKGRYLYNILSGYAPSSFKFEEEEIEYVKVDDLNYLQKGFYLKGLGNKVEKLKSESPFPIGSILFPKRGAAIRLNKIAITKNSCYFDTNLMGLEIFSSNLEPVFLCYFISNRGLMDIADTTTIPQINNKHISPMEIILPPREEQIEIIQHIENESTRIDNKIAKAEKYINLLTEYRTALISEVVTGKIKVID